MRSDRETGRSGLDNEKQFIKFILNVSLTPCRLTLGIFCNKEECQVRQHDLFYVLLVALMKRRRYMGEPDWCRGCAHAKHASFSTGINQS